MYVSPDASFTSSIVNPNPLMVSYGAMINGKMLSHAHHMHITCTSHAYFGKVYSLDLLILVVGYITWRELLQYTDMSRWSKETNNS